MCERKQVMEFCVDVWGVVLVNTALENLCELPWRGILWKSSRSFGIRTNGRIYTRSYLQSSLSFSLSPYCIFIHLGIIISGIGIAISILRSMNICRGRYFPKAICCIHGARCWGVICSAHMLIMMIPGSPI